MVGTGNIHLGYPTPYREGEPAAGAQDAKRLGDELLRTGQVKNAEVGAHRVEGRVGERQLLRVAFNKLHRGPRAIGAYIRPLFSST